MKLGSLSSEILEFRRRPLQIALTGSGLTWVQKTWVFAVGHCRLPYRQWPYCMFRKLSSAVGHRRSSLTGILAVNFKNSFWTLTLKQVNEEFTYGMVWCSCSTQLCLMCWVHLLTSTWYGWGEFLQLRQFFTLCALSSIFSWFILIPLQALLIFCSLTITSVDPIN